MTRSATPAITATKMIHHLLQPLLSILKRPDKVLEADDETLDTETFLQVLPFTLASRVTFVDEAQDESLEKESKV